jgi:hypothetical protein
VLFLIVLCHLLSEPHSLIGLIEAMAYAATAVTALFWHQKVWVCYVLLAVLSLGDVLLR